MSQMAQFKVTSTPITKRSKPRCWNRWNKDLRKCFRSSFRRWNKRRVKNFRHSLSSNRAIWRSTLAFQRNFQVINLTRSQEEFRRWRVSSWNSTLNKQRKWQDMSSKLTIHSLARPITLLKTKWKGLKSWSTRLTCSTFADWVQIWERHHWSWAILTTKR